MPGFIYSADTHLVEQVWKGRPIYNDTFVALRQLVDLAKSKQAKLVLGGDVFDTPRPPSMSFRVLQWASETLDEAGCGPLYLISGNHDAAEPDWAGAIYAASNLDHTLEDIDGILVYGLNYTHRDDVDAELDTIPEATDVVVMHQLLDMAIPLEGVWNMLASQTHNRGVELFLLGDYHDASVFESGGVTLAYPGSPVCMSMSEVASKRSCLHVYRDGSDITLSKHSLETRPIYSHKQHPELRVLDAAGRAELVHFVKTVMIPHQQALPKEDFDNFDTRQPACTSWHHIYKPLMRIQYDPSVISLLDLQKLVGEDTYLWATPIKALDAELAELPDDDEISPLHALNELIYGKLGKAFEVNPDMLFAFIKDIIEADNPSEVLKVTRERFGLTEPGKTSQPVETSVSAASV